jgi:hypothetical protein
MSLRIVFLKIVTAAAGLAAVVATSAVWVVLTDPVAVTRAVSGGRGLDVRDVAWFVGLAIRSVLRWL